ncbi:MAG TPA: IPT/TIG domain-containing protein, partial [Chryseolinea sp.]|nr:IPT/TIG domain-containing protein [Chryseolinea sp.]
VNTNEVDGITTAGALLHGEITFASVPILDHGFLWSDRAELTFGKADKISLGAMELPGSFEAQCDRGLKEGKKYYARAYAQSEDHIVYGDVVEFISLGGKAPLLKDFYPKTGSWHDTVTLVGQNLSVVTAGMVVKFNNSAAYIMSGSSDTVRVKVPFELTDKISTISLTLVGNVAVATEKFHLKNPTIESITPSSGVVGTIVTVTGDYLMSSKTKVYFGDVEGEFVEWGSNFVKCKVPQNVPSGSIQLKVVTGDDLSASTPFNILGPRVIELSPAIGFLGEIITIKGEFFGPTIESNTVTFEGEYAQVIAASTNEIQVSVPYGVYGSSPTVEVSYNTAKGSIEGFQYRSPEIFNISPTRGGINTDITISGKYFNQSNNTKAYLDDQQMTYSYVSTSEEIHAPVQTITKHQAAIKVSWFDLVGYAAQTFNMPLITLNEYPGDYLIRAVGFTHNNMGYVGLGSYELSKQLWRFDPNSQTWSRLNDFPGSGRYDAVSFTVGTKAYVASGTVGAIEGNLKDLWEYDFDNDAWIRKADLPLGDQASLAFSTANGAYLIENNYTTLTASIWRYNQASDTWSSLAPIPSVFRNDFFLINDDVYVLDQNGALWKFTSSTEQWTNVGTCPPNIRRVFSSNGKGQANGYSQMYRFDPATNTWEGDLNTAVTDPSMALTIDGKGYLLGDETGKRVYEYDGRY